MLRGAILVTVAALHIEFGCAGRIPNLGSPSRFLIVSSPANGTVLAAEIPEGGFVGAVRLAILLKDLKSPQGLAVDLKSSKLIVTDPVAKTIIRYSLHKGASSLVASDPQTIADNVETRWVAVDPEGAVYYTDETSNTITVIPPRKNGTTVVDGSTETTLSSPGGLALDSFNIYWVNKALGTQVGSVVKAPKSPLHTAGNASRFLKLSTAKSAPQVLTTNSDKSYGVCLAMQNVFYTQPEATIYGFSQQATGAAPTVVSDRLTNPRGCAFDGDGTVYVADRGANAIYSFAGNMQTLSSATLTKAADVSDAFGVAIFTSSARRATELLFVFLPMALNFLVA